MSASAPVTAATSRRAHLRPEPGGRAGAEPASVLPPPSVSVESDGVLALFHLLSQASDQQTRAAKTDIAVRDDAKRSAQEAQKAAIARARQAAEQEKGFFDSIGLAGTVGILAGSPLLVLGDVSMHLARLTPDALSRFEAEHADTLALATKLTCAWDSGAILAQGALDPSSVRAAVALGGLLVQETEALGEESSDWASAAMVVSGSPGRTAVAVVVADKDTAVASAIRAVERDTREYTRYVALAGMVLAAGAAIVGSMGTAAAPVVLVGVALSAGGFGVTETRCLDPFIGEDASAWIGGGMMIGGAVLTGAGASAAAAHVGRAAEAARALTVTGGVLAGGARVRQGLEQVQSSATRHAVDAADRDATRHRFTVERLQRMVEQIVESVRGLAESQRRIARTVSEVVETECRTPIICLTGRA